MNRTQIIALIIILLYMGATVLIGLIASKRKEEKKQSNDDFLMAGKSLGPVVLAGTLFAANTGGASTTGIATNVFKIWFISFMVCYSWRNWIYSCVIYSTIF